MNFWKWLLLVALLLIFAPCHAVCAAVTSVTFAMGDRGLRSLQYNGTEMLWANPTDAGGGYDGSAFYVARAVLGKPGGPDVTLDRGGPNKVTIDAAKGLVTRTFDWGSIKCLFAAQGSHLNMTITIANTSRDQTVKSVFIQPLWLRFPAKPREYDGNTPMLAPNLGRPSVVSMDYGTGTMALCNDDVQRPLLIGFPWSLDRPASTVYPLQISSGPTDWLSPYIDPYLQRPIAPGHSDTYTLSLRFGPAGTKAQDLAADLEKSFVRKYPSELNWADRRPIGYLMLSSTVPHIASGKNPRGWFNNDASIDITTPEGREDFRKRLMAYADGSIKVLKDIGAQGAITWDIQGQEYPHATSYIGDPRLTPTLAPEIDPFADAYFKKFRDAGLRVGVCLRPETFVKTPTGATQLELDLNKPDAIAQTLIDRARYASKRWGCTLFYVDSNGDPNVPYDAGIFQRVAETLAKDKVKVLLMPEHKNLRYFAYTAPYAELRQGYASTPEQMRRVYPNSFSVINIADGPTDERHDDLVAAVKHGDILLFRAWWPDPYNDKLKAIYRESLGK